MSLKRITTARLLWQRDGDQWVAPSASGEYRITCWSYPRGDEYVVTYRHRLWSETDGRASVGEYDTLLDAKTASMAFERGRETAREGVDDMV